MDLANGDLYRVLSKSSNDPIDVIKICSNSHLQEMVSQEVWKRTVLLQNLNLMAITT